MEAGGIVMNSSVFQLTNYRARKRITTKTPVPSYDAGRAWIRRRQMPIVGTRATAWLFIISGRLCKEPVQVGCRNSPINVCLLCVNMFYLFL